jgi:hypothetical protein
MTEIRSLPGMEWSGWSTVFVFKSPYLVPEKSGTFFLPKATHLSVMCNAYELNVAWAQYRAAMRAADIGIAERQVDLDLPRLGDVRRRRGCFGRRLLSSCGG